LNESTRKIQQALNWQLHRKRDWCRRLSKYPSPKLVAKRCGLLPRKPHSLQFVHLQNHQQCAYHLPMFPCLRARITFRQRALTQRALPNTTTVKTGFALMCTKNICLKMDWYQFHLRGQCSNCCYSSSATRRESREKIAQPAKNTPIDTTTTYSNSPQFGADPPYNM